MHRAAHSPNSHRLSPPAAARQRAGWIGLIRAVRARWYSFCLRSGQVRTKHLNEAAIHDFRVSGQRLVATLRLAEPVAGPVAKKLRHRVKKRIDAVRRLRDVQVMLLRTAPAAGESPVLARLHRKLSLEEQTLTRGLKQRSFGSIRREERAQARQVLAALIRRARVAHGASPARFLRGQLLSGRRRVVLRAGQIDPGDLMTLHRLRMAIKRARYLLELAASVAPTGRYTTAQRSARNWQDTLGRCQDLRVLHAELESLHPKRSPEQVALGQFRVKLIAERDEAVREFLRQRVALGRFIDQLDPARTPRGANRAPTLRLVSLAHAR